MRYSPDIIKQVVAELEKAPVIRHVCAKVGIDHSTFYRWMTKHPTFLKSVLNALWLGRKRMNDTAESVIIGGIQNHSIRAATFWLSHNEERYMSFEKAKHHQMLEAQLYEVMHNDLPEDYPTTFEKLFDVMYDNQRSFGTKITEKMMRPLIELVFREDPSLIDLFYASYEGWKRDKEDLKKRGEELGVKDPKEDEE